MPIGLVSDDDLQKELENLSAHPIQIDPIHPIPIHPIPIQPPTRGRSDGDINVPNSLRQIIGETAVIDGRRAALKLASDFGISPSSVSAYAKGATSTTTYDTPSKSIISHINKSRQRAIKRAGNTLNAALSAITQEKLDYADVSDLSGIAKDMSVIIKNLEPPHTGPGHDGDGDRAPQFVIYAPTFRDERSFETIEVKE